MRDYGLWCACCDGEDGDEREKDGANEAEPDYFLLSDLRFVCQIDLKLGGFNS